ncbi:MAG: hypothetical protein Q6L68_08270 [Thermostichus sp. DG02_5_bins_236]
MGGHISVRPSPKAKHLSGGALRRILVDWAEPFTKGSPIHSGDFSVNRGISGIIEAAQADLWDPELGPSYSIA